MKKQLKLQLRLLIITSLLILISDSCKKDEPKDEPKIFKEKVDGQVQKGPFINGTSITISELNSSLVQIGNIFTTQINNNKGSFQIENISLTSGFVEFSANGFYFDEVKGTLSVAPLNLYALTDLTNLSTVNVNILTHLEKQRVNFLKKQGKTFSEAKNIALQEILAIFGYDASDIKNSESLDISVNNESNAILLAVSIILQANRSVGELIELLASISNDIKEDGNLNDTTILNDLRDSARELDLLSIKINLGYRYKDLGVSTIIPSFEKYVKEFLAFTGEKPTIKLEPITRLTTTGVRFNATVNPGFVNTIVTFEYGETTSYGYLTPEEFPAGGTSVIVSADASPLLPGKVYHFRAKAVNAKGIAYTEDDTFTTLGKVPEAMTIGASDIFLNSAIVNGSVKANHLATEVVFEWGTTNEYGNTVIVEESLVSGDTAINVKAELSGLQEETTFHYRLRTKNSLGIAYGADKIFTTAGKSPVPVTRDATNVQKNTASLNGSVNANSSKATVSFEWGMTTAYGNITNAAESPFTGNTYTAVTAELTGLEMGTEYHFRIIAENEFGKRFSDDMTFTTLLPVTDIDGNVYDVKRYGNQVWMLENLKTTRYNNGDLIETTTPANLYISWESSPKFQWAYNGDESYVDVYGRLYTWYAATDNRNICPTGWHVPTDREWTVFSDYLINSGYGFEGSGNDIAKSLASTSGWGYNDTPGNIGNDQSGNNRSGFTALPGGIRQPDSFELAGIEGIWWSSTTSGYWEEIAWQRRLYPSASGFENGGLGTKSVGISVRCLKD